MVAADVSPTIAPSACRIAPAPRKPIPETICAAMRVVSPYGRPSGVKPICAMSIESCVNSAAPTQIRMFVRSPAGLFDSSRSMPIAPPRSVASSSLTRTVRRSADANAAKGVD